MCFNQNKNEMDRFLAHHFLKKVLALPNTPESIKKAEKLRIEKKN